MMIPVKMMIKRPKIYLKTFWYGESVVCQCVNMISTERKRIGYFGFLISCVVFLRIFNAVR